jgi:spore coat polysaccharide biosynthesis protein SpsF
MFLHNDADYVGNSLVRSFPDGMDTQVFRLDTLKRSASLTRDRLDREHVSRHMCHHPELFRHLNFVAPPRLHWPHLGLTLDEHADYLLLRRVIETLAPANPLFGCHETLDLLRANPDWVAINRDVIRKGDS